jgi:hypothetical protein
MSPPSRSTRTTRMSAVGVVSGTAVSGEACFATSDQGLDAALAGPVEFELARVGVEGSAWLGSQVASG